MAKKRAVESKIRYRISLYLDVPEEAKIHEYLDSIENDLLLRGIELRRMLRAGYRALAAREGNKGLLANTNRASSLDDDDDVLPTTPRPATKPKKVAPPAPKTVVVDKQKEQIDIEEVIAATDSAPSALPEVRAAAVEPVDLKESLAAETSQAASPESQKATQSDNDDDPLARMAKLMASREEADLD
jgi:hypothetical protein